MHALSLYVISYNITLCCNILPYILPCHIISFYHIPFQISSYPVIICRHIVSYHISYHRIVSLNISHCLISYFFSYHFPLSHTIYLHCLLSFLILISYRHISSHNISHSHIMPFPLISYHVTLHHIMSYHRISLTKFNIASYLFCHLIVSHVISNPLISYHFTSYLTSPFVCLLVASQLYINYQLDAQIIIYSYNVILLYVFRAMNAHLQEVTLDTCSIWYCHSLRAVVVAGWYTLNLCTDRPPRPLVESEGIKCCMYTVWPPEDEHLWLETCKR